MNERLGRALAGRHTLREMIVGSFEVYMTIAAQRTNDVMKVLTVTSALLLPPSLLVAILGTSFDVGFYREPAFFVLGLVGMLGLSVGALVFIRRKGWL